MGGHGVDTIKTPLGTVVPNPPRSHTMVGLVIGTIAWAWIVYRFKNEGRMRFVCILFIHYDNILLQLMNERNEI